MLWKFLRTLSINSHRKIFKRVYNLWFGLLVILGFWINYRICLSLENPIHFAPSLSVQLQAPWDIGHAGFACDFIPAKQCVCVCVCVSCLVMSDSCDPMDCSLPGSSVHGILQARILERVAIPFSRGFSWPRDQTGISCIADRFCTI